MDFKISLAKPLGKTLKSKIENVDIQVGILDDKPYKQAKSKKSGTQSVAGGPALRTGQNSKLTVSEVARFARNASKVNFLTKPFEAKTTEIAKLTKAFLQMVLGGGSSEQKRIEALLTAIVRGPILRGEYGRDKNSTAKQKGFNRKLIRTGQLLSAIRAKVRLSRAS